MFLTNCNYRCKSLKKDWDKQDNRFVASLNPYKLLEKLLLFFQRKNIVHIYI